MLGSLLAELLVGVDRDLHTPILLPAGLDVVRRNRLGLSAPAASARDRETPSDARCAARENLRNLAASLQKYPGQSTDAN